MTLTLSQYHRDEFVVENGDARDVALATAVGARQFNRQLHLTQARATKFHLLRDWGFEAVTVNGRWRYRRGTSRLLTLDHAMICIEVMGSRQVNHEAVA